MIGHTRYHLDSNARIPSPEVSQPTVDRDKLKHLTVDEELLASYDGAVPQHIAVIMDGNGRWATQKG